MIALLIPLAAAVGGAVWELVLRPASKTEVVQYDSAHGVVDANSNALTKEGIEHDLMTNGAFSWILVKPADRVKAVQVVSASTKQYLMRNEV